jgi:His/Glu/Gln/Arg/opine family amino acid ABC transporter permease subunit
MSNYLGIISEAWPALLEGLKITVILTVLSLALGLVIGMAMAIMRLSRIYLLRATAHVYIDVIRGTPLLVQLFLVYYGLPQFGIRLTPIVAAVLTLGFHYGAYLAEVFRAGLMSVDRGQWEAAESLGFKGFQLYRRIILPQAIRVALPGIGNYANSMVKDTSLASVVTVMELLRSGQIIVASTFQSFEIYLTVAAMYLAISMPLAWFTRRLESRSNRGYA